MNEPERPGRRALLAQRDWIPRRRLFLLGATAAALSACAPRVVRQTVMASDAQAQELSARAFSAFRMQGRVALSDGDQGGSGRLIWEQHGGNLDVRFSAPVSQRTWRLQRDESGARLIDDQGVQHQHHDLQQLLDQVWSVGVPVEALSFWLRGSRLPGAGRVALDSEGRVQQLQQAGWTVDYLRSQDPADELPLLPAKLYASSGERWVRVVIQRWQAIEA